MITHEQLSTFAIEPREVTEQDISYFMQVYGIDILSVPMPEQAILCDFRVYGASRTMMNVLLQFKPLDNIDSTPAIESNNNE